MERKMNKRMNTKRNKEIKNFPEYCTGYYRENPETEKADCPRCGDALPAHTGALSWDGKTEICPAYGDIEGIEALIFGYKAYAPYRGTSLNPVNQHEN